LCSRLGVDLVTAIPSAFTARVDTAKFDGESEVESACVEQPDAIANDNAHNRNLDFISRLSRLGFW